MKKEQIDTILKNKIIPLTFGLALDHYSIANVLSVPICYFIYNMLFNNQVDTFLLVLSIIFFIPALTIYLYVGPRQLRLKKIHYEFENNFNAYSSAYDTIKYLNWTIIEDNGINHIKATRSWTNLIFNKGFRQEINIFIENNYIYIISLNYPNSIASFPGNRNDKNVNIFQSKIKYRP